MRTFKRVAFTLTGVAALFGVALTPTAKAQQKPTCCDLMTDDTGWNDFGAYGGGANLGHPTPKIDQRRRRGRRLYQLVRPGELHRRPRLLHNRSHPDPLGAIRS